MRRRRVALACQGGGSQCAFVAGVLRALFAARVQDRFEIVGLSGTSGGAITAAVAWLGLLEEAQGGSRRIEDRIAACWRDLTAQTPREIALDAACVHGLRMAERGWVPTYAVSPSSPPLRAWSDLVAWWIARPEFTDLGAVLQKHVPLDRVDGLIGPRSPALLVGAADVIEGSLKVFSSRLGEIKADSLLASAAIPTLFPAVWVDGHAYWDGIFASNPPLIGFLREALMGVDMLPQEIWVVQVNPPSYDDVPDKMSDIFDRRNKLGGNLSLQHELQLIHVINLLIREGALSDAFRARFGIVANEGINVRFVRMSPELAKGLDYPSKLSRQPSHIARLMAEGERQGRAFLTALPADDTWGERRASEQPVAPS